MGSNRAVRPGIPDRRFSQQGIHPIQRRGPTLRQAMAALERLQRTRDAWNRIDRLREGCPKGRDRVEAETPTRPRKARLTLRRDRDTATWVWRQGAGTQVRMNAVLRAYMLATMSKMA